MKIGLIDYGAGNLHSARNALVKVGAPCQLVTGPEDLQEVERLVLPGVGACVDCVRQLQVQGLWEPLRAWLEADRPFLGICIGYQILFDHSEEFEGADGLGILPGRVVKFPHSELKVPHMGWNALDLRNSADPLWAGLPEKFYVYFVHSYYPQLEDEDLVNAWCDYGVRFAAAIRRGQTVATQFHPEKSQAIGLRILKNFASGAS